MAYGAVGFSTWWKGGSCGYCHIGSGEVQGAGGRGTATEEPPPDGHQWVPKRRGFCRTRTSRGGWGTGCGWGVGAAFWCPKWPVPLSRLFGGGLESHINPLKSVRRASEWCGVDHHHVSARCAKGYPRKRPGSTPNPKFGSEIGGNHIIKLTRFAC
jgi:hypothetical protein